MNKGQQLLEAVDEHGEIGILDSAAKQEGTAANEKNLAVRLGDGAMIFVDADRLTAAEAGKYHYHGSFADARRSHSIQTPISANRQNQNEQNSHSQNLAAINARTNEGGEIVVPLIAEELVVTRKTVETGGVRVHKTVREDVQTINEPIIREHLDIERVQVNKFVETAPVIRYEGDVMIVPVLEEVVVTQKRLLLREEIRLTKRREEIADVQEIILRREEINLEKIETDKIEPETPGRSGNSKL